MIIISNSRRIRAACAYKGISVSELARRWEVSPQALSQRMNTDKFTDEEMKELAKLLDAVYISFIRFPDGTEI